MYHIHYSSNEASIHRTMRFGTVIATPCSRRLFVPLPFDGSFVKVHPPYGSVSFNLGFWVLRVCGEHQMFPCVCVCACMCVLCVVCCVLRVVCCVTAPYLKAIRQVRFTWQAAKLPYKVRLYTCAWTCVVHTLRYYHLRYYLGN